MTEHVTGTNVGKMTEQEAIHEIEMMEQMECACPDCERRRPALVMAIEALQKQIPKKPIKEDEYSILVCPSCKEWVESTKRFCYCGQRLDWEG